MAEQVDVGTAISLGTNLQPDRTRPLTQASQNWLQMEIRREAARAKKEQDSANKVNMLIQSLTGDASEFPDINDMYKQNYQQSVSKMMEKGAVGDIQGANLVKQEALMKNRELKDIETRRRALIKETKGTNAEELGNVLAQYGEAGAQQWGVENKDLSIFSIKNGVLTLTPTKRNVDMAKVFDGIINRTQAPLELEGTWQNVFDNKFRTVGELSDEDLTTMARGLSMSNPYVENYYMDNRNRLRPQLLQLEASYEKRPEKVAEAQAANLRVIDIAKRDLVREEFINELKDRRRKQVTATKAKDINISIGTKPSETTPVLNYKSVDPDEWTQSNIIFEVSDIPSENRRAPVISNVINRDLLEQFKGRAVEGTDLNLGIAAAQRQEQFARRFSFQALDGFSGKKPVQVKQTQLPMLSEKKSVVLTEMRKDGKGVKIQRVYNPDAATIDIVQDEKGRAFGLLKIIQDGQTIIFNLEDGSNISAAASMITNLSALALTDDYLNPMLKEMNATNRFKAGGSVGISKGTKGKTGRETPSPQTGGGKEKKKVEY